MKVKSLILKDLYMAKATSRYVLLFVLGIEVMIAAKLLGNASFWMVYTGVLAGSVPLSMLYYDLGGGWRGYSAALPLTAGQLVSAKYLLGLLIGGSLFLLSLLSQGGAALYTGAGVLQAMVEALGNAVMAALVCCLSTAFLLPLTIRFGVERARAAYYVLFGGMAGLFFVLIKVLPVQMPDLAVPAPGLWAELLVLAAAVGFYAGSWLLSIAWYQRKG